MRQFIALILFVIVASCAQPAAKEHVKDKPAFSTEITDPEIKVISDEYFRLSAYNNMHFNNKVSIGFSKIDRSNVIGTCTYQHEFREIDLDKRFWSNSTWFSKIALLYHEMTHCYCERGHDFDEGEVYPDVTLQEILGRFLSRIPLSPLKPSGYLDDFCPKSVMHPIIMDDECFEKHYNYYVKEMFARCNPF